MSSTVSLRVCYAFCYISMPSFTKQCELPNPAFSEKLFFHAVICRADKLAHWMSQFTLNDLENLFHFNKVLNIGTRLICARIFLSNLHQIGSINQS